ncbi:fungal-specific transcription factor domain-containing protein [Dactylonectria estremocensis]|uniref:Fungal-specific transcription factor domain-containing protein n=1 Tax=Dactylonectria estremocensis TaxID=1079267 RepID=A0A9P9J5N4_9HYPO|nr:fungal-specific transcription factor domain-containing protein [Dactylonectria estremocensis]
MPTMSTQLRFRFWSASNQRPPSPPGRDPSPAGDNTRTRGKDAPRSRSGCTECKRRRVKCDETFPVCIRCQKRASFCQSAPRLTKWQPEAPWIKLGTGLWPSSDVQPPGALNPDDKALLRYWLERASQIMVIDPDENPLSFPILEYLDQSPSLKHALQSVGAGHRNYFHPEKLSKCLEERSSALRSIIHELSYPGDNLFPLFLSVLLVGLSTAWTNPPTADFGQQHLRGARALVDILVSNPSDRESRPPYFNLVIGAYLYWDMATAFLIPAEQQVPLNNADMYSAVLDVGQEYHPIGGYSTEIFYLLGNVGRYCRSVVETGIRDASVEVALEEEMEKWEPNRDNPQLGLVSDAFRSHGLISLAAICYRRRSSEAAQDAIFSAMLSAETEEAVEWWQDLGTCFVDDELEASICSRALAVVQDLTSIPSSHACTNLQAIPLFTAGSELTKEDKRERDLVLQRFKELYSLNHLRANLTALQVLPEIWERRDAGETISWLELMIEKNWNIMLG